MTAQSGFSDEKLARIPRFLEGKVAGGELPGAQTLIWRRGRIVHHSLVGLSDIARGTPLREDAVFRIYSMTKPVTLVALLMLLEQGRIALDDAVSKYIPGFARLRLADGRAPARMPTLLDLARHTAGFTYGFHNRTPIDALYRQKRIGEFDTEGGLAAMMTALEDIPLEYSPGDAWIYSVATDVLGYVVEAVSERSYADFVRENILAPLQMADTDFWVPPGKQNRFTACYGQKDRLELFDDAQGSTWFAPPKLESGGGGLVGTAADYLRFARLLLNKGELDGVRLLKPDTVALMTRNHLPGGKEIADLTPSADAFNESGYRGIGFGLGVAVTLDPARVGIPGSAGELAWGGMASTTFFVDPQEDMAVVFMTQVITDTARRVKLRRDLRTLVYEAMTERAT
jgi:CubicO group peptidase (beta-lactamase class C family)